MKRKSKRISLFREVPVGERHYDKFDELTAERLL